MADELMPICSSDRQMHADLAAANLPVSDLGKGSQMFWRLGPADQSQGYVGVETHGSHALLRSLLVMPEYQGRGLGRALVDYAIEQAGPLGVDELWLLTNTAAGLFDRLGWVRRDRGEAPDGIAASEEFTSLCPATAVCFSRRIKL